MLVQICALRETYGWNLPPDNSGVCNTIIIQNGTKLLLIEKYRRNNGQYEYLTLSEHVSFYWVNQKAIGDL